MFHFLCECLQRKVAPSVSEILQANQQHAVCVDGQCFESLDDIVPMQTPSTPPSMLQVVPLLLLISFLAYTRSRGTLSTGAEKQVSH